MTPELSMAIASVVVAISSIVVTQYKMRNREKDNDHTNSSISELEQKMERNSMARMSLQVRIDALEVEVARLQTENIRLMRMLIEKKDA